uniref:Uncharacterized protein n=1 Tax=Oryza barthii TaxID=65489 RepID=A0A0D3H054_9ORYZ
MALRRHTHRCVRVLAPRASRTGWYWVEVEPSSWMARLGVVEWRYLATATFLTKYVCKEPIAFTYNSSLDLMRQSLWRRQTVADEGEDASNG